ncbi:MAG: phosphoenolpyruvate synthase [Candidatus Pacebacteria bacterium]|nr:phosphoenolpyruvate synthase [Candidatus Paceibacterota bacterium]
MTKKYTRWLKDISKKDGAMVGGKNSSLGEMFSKLQEKGVNVPGGFVTTSDAFWYFLEANGIDKKAKKIFDEFNPKSLASLKKTGAAVRGLILNGKFPEDLEKEIIENYRILSSEYGEKETDVAVRSSATAEDLKTASFAGQMETFLNIRGENELLKAVKKCFASLFTDRAIFYREDKGFKHLEIALSACIQKMVRSDLASSGIIFTLDTESGFQNVILINSIFGVGEMIVQGKITPDQFYVFKPTLKSGYRAVITRNLGRKTGKYVYKKEGGLKEEKVPLADQERFSLNEEEVLTLAKWALIIEEHYGNAQDIEWAKDGKSGKLFIVQSRPETVHASEIGNFYEEYSVKADKAPVLTGIAIGNKIGAGKINIIPNVAQINKFKKGEILVTRMTDPDWVPIMRIASAIVTDEGGKTAHAAIVSRELGIPCIVGTRIATKTLTGGKLATVDCTQGSVGRVYSGIVPFEVKKYDLKKIPETKTKIMLNIGAPDIAFKTSFLPSSGVGLAREEFIIAERIKIHPLALFHYPKLKDKKAMAAIEEITFGYKNKKEYFVEELAEGISLIASAFFPKEVIVRLSDFKTNEYAALIGGKEFEPAEDNPMIGFRGASRYYDKSFEPAFRMECQAIKRSREVFGLNNITVMVPFCRTPEEGKKVLNIMKEEGLEKGKEGLKVIVMCEIPSNVILAEKFLDVFDGMSIGSNDLTQLVLGVDRDNAHIAYLSDERNEAVKEMIAKVIGICRERKKYIGICGQAPSDYPEFAEFLVENGIESISLNPDTVIKTTLKVAEKEKSTNYKL